MFDDNDQDALDAEYVLGTLSPNERDQAEALLTIDPGFAAIVRQWESRLGELNVMVEAVEPPPGVWDRIKAQIGGPTAVPFTLTESPLPQPPASAAPPSFEAPPAAPEQNLTPSRPAGFTPLDQTPPPPPPAPELQDAGASDMLSQLAILASRLSPSESEAKTEIAGASASPAPPAPPPPAEPELSFEGETARASESGADAEPPAESPAGLESPPPPPPPQSAALAPAPAIERESNVIDLTAQMRRWRGLTLATGALAAALAVYIALTRFVPGIVPPGGTSPAQQTASQPVKPPPSRLVAALQREPVAPAFLVTVDSQSKTLTVRRLAAAADPGKSYELWVISKQFQNPHSLGIVGQDEFTQRTLPANLDVATLRAASYAVSLEPAGGSPSGVPTGPVLFTGKLVESMPGAPPG
jgi:anti-sigma-K factor RskA